MRFIVCRASAAALLLAVLPSLSTAQDSGFFAGVISGSSQLSGDPSSVVTPAGFATSVYKPETGPAVNAFVGIHLREYVTIQANYTWNRNDVAFFAALGTPTGNRFYEQPHSTIHHTFIGDVLVYFRERSSRIRPYLSGGLGLLHLSSEGRSGLIDGGLRPPPATFTTTDFTTRVAVGADVPVGHGWGIRYSFSENLGPNPLSRQLDPQGRRGLMNFQNLVGVMRTF
jgi:hypothetical protein